MVFEICAALGTAALIIFFAYAVAALRAFKETARKAKQTLVKIDHELPELTKLIRNATSLTSDVKAKIDSFDFIFKPLAKLGRRTGKESGSAKKKGDNVDKILDYVGNAIVLFKKFKGR